MRIPFALWSAVIALLVFAGMAAREFLNFGSIEFAYLWPIGLKIGGVWLALVIVATIIGGLRKATTASPDALPDDVARELRRHPED
ncbi:hypothetical protein [Maricaulis sp.]|jgi:hypothetical protein|uniref:hypothetical protein n=1 Tax=Maricaulis sp. TaxID=1486257 RepID=UPI0025D23171|nr:hypothetical protein [Maricaulis sp.]MDF1768094.1 hypothetical protein [Maricaulis sp.]